MSKRTIYIEFPDLYEETYARFNPYIDNPDDLVEDAITSYWKLSPTSWADVYVDENNIEYELYWADSTHVVINKRYDS